MSQVFDIEPRITSDVHIGDKRRQTLIYAGKLAEKGPGSAGRVHFDGSDNFVVLEVGKRGSGKSYGMGSLLEGFATSAVSKISSQKEERAVLLLDPLDIHWTAILPLSADGPEGIKRQHKVLASWPDLEVEKINVAVWMPAGFAWDIDHPEFREYFLPVSALDADDWALLLQTDIMLETRGRLIYEAFQKVTNLGWEASRVTHAPRADYSIQDLIDCVSGETEINSFYHPETIRSVIQPLMSYARMKLFSAREGTPMTELVRKGQLSVLSLGRLGEDLRTVLTTVVVRKLRKDRMVASQISRRLALQQLDDATKARLKEELKNHVPRTVLAIDEAQILMPQKSNSPARRALDSFILEGRNYGLSLWLATQRPKGAISDAAASQIDTFIVHRLSVNDDIIAVCNLLQNAKPDKIRKGGSLLDLSDLIRSLDVGQAVISSATSDAPRLIVVNIRPRMVAHGGEAF
jgi:uncharacterized protein